MSAELSASMGFDISDFTRSIDNAISQLNGLSSQASAQMEKIATSVAPATSAMSSLAASTEPVTAAIKNQQAAVEQHSRTWRGFASDTVKGTRSASQSFGDFAAPLGSALRLAGMFYPQLKRIGTVMAISGYSAQALGKHYDSTAQATAKVAEANQKAAKSSEAMHSSITSLATTMASKGAMAAVLWKVGIGEATEAAAKFLSPNSELVKSTMAVGDSLMTAANTGFNLFTEGARNAFTTALQAMTGFESITAAVDAGGNMLTSWAKTAETAVKGATEAVQEGALRISAFLASMGRQGAGFDSSAYIEEGRRLNELAAESAKTMEKQNQVKSMLTSINDAAGKAASEARTKNELARISTLDNVEAIEQEIQALKQSVNAKIMAGQVDKNWKKEQEDKASALGKRKEDLISGPQKKEGPDETAKAIEAAQKKIDGLTMGEDAVAIATAKASNATAEQVEVLTEKLAKIREINEAQSAAKQVEEANKKATEQLQGLQDEYAKLTGSATEASIAMRKALEQKVDPAVAGQIGELTEKLKAMQDQQKKEAEAANAFKKFEEKIAEMKDAADLAAGKKTKGQVAEAKALREGATAEQAKELGELTDAEEAKKEKESKGGKGGGSADNQAVLAGTAEAAKLAFGGSSRLESLTERHIKATEKVASAIANIKPVEFTVADIGI